MVDFLSDAGLGYWQICPVGPTGYGDSPYQSFSSYAGNPYFIDWAPLEEAGLVTAADLEPLRALPRRAVDFGGLYERFWPVLRKAARAFFGRKENPLGYGSYDQFRFEQRTWLDPYCRFQAVKRHFGGGDWRDWPKEWRVAAKAGQRPLPDAEAEEEFQAQAFAQYVWTGQWNRLREYGQGRGVRIVGDIPIFVALDSADLWSEPEWFQVDPGSGQPRAVAGVPPDYFSADGQFWGNPLYDWGALAQDGYGWWLRRLRRIFSLVDVVRIDHFRGFHDYWAIPAKAKTAREGQWLPGPDLDFFRVVRKSFPDARIIAEDLGMLSPGVEVLRKQSGLPGMAVLHFAFDPKAQSQFLPHHISADKVVYTGTHDNDTSWGWYRSVDEETRDFFRRYLRVDGSSVPWDLLRAAWECHANLAIVPLQDLLNLGPEARLNTPGKPTGNWTWRVEELQLEGLRRSSSAYLRELGWLYGRLG